ncbi:hypothetical protein SPRG_01569 [Saprolegnia parasitica CBS 223.65]|uniref:Tubby C-terminal domain-containing protein n=1 Tax=Saprolegnia parasitica (strain CBS 223.65) TaxID=695850 RepID=A0A067CUN9_SAPPC|nr:hypothetical protein SPRG_01569 [Saprolegnia parasitica CBS 223.65]KDO34434.1 hypothetical protein SPRG_01569 [Saprolegnia parasitica CBS 223.65]|eukprot:XP_012195165.1 hypothetical protein SPRG_01569 [Saprolegnia parasitica CBS 223.65]
MSDEDLRPVELMPPFTPITAIDSKFVLADPVRLKIRHRHNVDVGEFIIRDEVTGAPYFIIDDKFWSLHDRKFLRDATGAELFTRFDATTFFGNAEVKCEFQDVVTKKRRVFAATGGAGSSVVLYCNGRPIAKWLKDWSFSDGGYVFLDVSPGVDLALIDTYRDHGFGHRQGLVVIFEIPVSTTVSDMGACLSDEPIPTPLLVAPLSPITAVDPRFVLKTPVRLHARYDWSSEGPFRIKDVATGVPYFVVDGALGPCHNRKTLRDANGVKVAVMDEPWTSGGRRDVSRINGSGEASLVFSFDTTFFLVCTDVRCEFVDLVTKQRHELTGSGSVGSWDMVFRCDGHVIATFEKDATLSDKYFLHIAAGVDLALIVLLCVGAQEASETMFS